MRRHRLLTVVAAVVTLVATACTTGGTSSSSSGAGSTDVTVWTPWGGSELKTFQDALKPFQQQTGIKVHVTTMRDVTTQISVGVDAGTSLPDISVAPPTDKLQDWASKGVVKPIESFLDMSAYVRDTFPALTTSSTSTNTDVNIGLANGKHYQEFILTSVKGLIWYNAKIFTGQAPTTWDGLLAINPSQYGAQKLFCAGFESGGASGWSASDDLDNIVMRQNDATVYNNWIAGKVKWSSPQIKQAFQAYLQMVSPDHLYGGPNFALSTNFGEAGKPIFANPPGCLFLEQATFITSFFKQDYPNLQAGTDYSFFPHPSLNPQYQGNIMGQPGAMAMYNDTPAARKLMQYMVSADFQQVWVNGGGALAALKTITTYPDPITKKASQMMASAKNVLPTAGDLMPSTMQAAFWKAMLDVTKTPSSLDSVLHYLDQVQASAYGS